MLLIMMKMMTMVYMNNWRDSAAILSTEVAVTIL